MESRDISLLSYNWYYSGIVLTIFNRKQFTYNISIITCKLHGAVACDGNTACVKMKNCMETFVWQSNLSIWMYTKDGAKGKFFNRSDERIQTWSVPEYFIRTDQNSSLCPRLSCRAVWKAEWWNGDTQYSPPPRILLLLFATMCPSALGF